MENYSLADISAVTGKENTGMFGGGIWIFALLILLLIGGGGFFGGRNGEAVTEAGLCNAMNFNNLENSIGRLSDSLQSDYMGIQNGLSNLGYETLRNFGTTQSQIAQCCCETQRAIDGVNYNGAINTAAINANTTEQTQKILDAFTGNRMAEMQNQINQLQLQAALCGIPRTNPYGYYMAPIAYGNACTGMTGTTLV
jgi:hypothetical protein|nr:MAG TPA: hypothetical protein [Caudoviricetes sp.]